jgi:hypothetical protein
VFASSCGNTPLQQLVLLHPGRVAHLSRVIMFHSNMRGSMVAGVLG